jgi:hypothetical protein
MDHGWIMAVGVHAVESACDEDKNKAASYLCSHLGSYLGGY